MKKRIVATVITLIICLSSVISVSASTYQHVIDYADKLAYSEIEELEAYAAKLENDYGICVMFCITEDTGNASADEFSSETYSEYTDNENGLIIVHDDWNDTYSVFISGNAGEVLTDDAVDSIRDAYDTNESYYGGIYACYKIAEEYLENGYSDGYIYNEEPAMGAAPPEDHIQNVMLRRLPIALVIGLIAGFIIINGIASKNKSVKMQKNATVYTRQGSLIITGSADNFLYKNVDRTAKPKPQNNTKS